MWRPHAGQNRFETRGDTAEAGLGLTLLNSSGCSPATTLRLRMRKVDPWQSFNFTDASGAARRGFLLNLGI
jgi:hypothetical protein